MEEVDREAAQPISASSLLHLEEKQRGRFTSKGERISTACVEVDESVLGGGGLDRGIVLGISAEGGEGRLLSFHLIVSILLTHVPTWQKPNNQTKAVIIDTTGSFPISLLAKVIRSRILQKRGQCGRQSVKTENAIPTECGQVLDEGVEVEVQKYLEMVAISRVFDVEGLWEVLGEVRQDSRSNINHEDDEEFEVIVAREEINISASRPAYDGAKPSAAREIVDSEDDSFTPNADDGRLTEPLEGQGDEGVEIIVIDSMIDIINELLARKEKTEAYNLLATLSKIIYNLSSQYNILTILHNSTISSKSSYPLNMEAQHPTRLQLQPLSISLSSVFSSNLTKPALGKVFDQFPSLHLMLSSMPKTQDDAEVLYGQDENSLSPSHVNYCTVLEVLKDETPNLGVCRSANRFGVREQRWVALAVSDDGLSLRHAFPDRDKR